ncbi:MAG: DUF6438 domain-containing protein [Bacteroidota bacterium]
MTRTLIIILLTFVCQHILANRIDNLKTDADVVEFLKSTNADFRSPGLNKIELRSSEILRQDLNCNGLAEKWQIKNWEKADFNQDGLTDLVVMLYWYDYGVYVIMDNGKNNFQLHTLSYNIYEKCELAKPILSNGQQLLLFSEKKIIDTLAYKYYGFVELNRHPSVYDIDSIEFRTGSCFNNCPVFSIKLGKDRNAVYEGGMYNPKQGKFTATLEYDKSQAIFDLVNYLSVKKLNDSYRVSWTDDQTCWLRIKFTDGTVKEIKDYGLKGTFGLRLIYSIFLDLRVSQNWK